MSFARTIKRKLYFFVAGYFRFWAAIYLKKWKPLVIVVTGSSGKTTLLHLFQAQLKQDAIYSHKANSAFGIPFHILGLERTTFSVFEWFIFFIKAPFQMRRKIPSEHIYVAEVDAERPGEAQFLASLLMPNIVVWLSLEEAHGINYDRLIKNTVTDHRRAVKEAMAHEFGYLLESPHFACAVINSDNEFIQHELSRSNAEYLNVSMHDIKTFLVEHSSITIESSEGTFHIPRLVPQRAGLSVLAVVKTLSFLHAALDKNFTEFRLPPGRSSVFEGIKKTTLIDSTYNATFDGMKSMLELFNQYPAQRGKWLVLGDMIEQGTSEAEEHRDLADMIMRIHPEKIVLVGPRLRTHTFPLLLQHYSEKKVVSYLMPGEAREYLEKNLHGEETILFKGARFLEGIVEKLLAHKEDSLKLCRREEIWVKKRKEWGI